MNTPSEKHPTLDSQVNPLTPTNEFRLATEKLGIIFDEGDLEKLGLFLALLFNTNKSFNLTRITDPDAAWMRHLFDSITLMGYLKAAEASTVIDIGSGGGLPGIPLAIVMPEIHFTLLEATGKKADFLRLAVAELSLSNVSIINDRAETLGQDREHHREQYDVVTARAVGKLPVLLEISLPLARVGGLVIAIKGEKAAEEVEQSKKALHMLHARVIEQIRTPTGTIVLIENSRTTPRKYPRQPGEPKRDPLT